MKQTARKLLSLVMAFAIMLTLAPVALAAGTGPVSITGTPTTNPIAGENVTVNLQANVSADSGYTDLVYSWTIGGKGTAATTNEQSVTISCKEAGEVTASVSVTGTKDGQSGQTVGSATTSFTVDSPTVAVTDVTVEPETASIAVGKTTKLTATVIPNTATNKSVTWSSNSTSVATVDNDGTVRGVAEGTAVITATTEDGGKTDTCTVTVTAPAPSITLSASANTVEYNKTISLTVTTENMPQGATVAFDVTGAGAGSVTGAQSPYTFTATKTGSVEIVAKLMSSDSKEVAKSTAVKVTVTDASIEATLTPSNKNPQANGTITATLAVAEGARSQISSVTWKVSPTANATISASQNYNAATGAAQASVFITKTGTLTITAELRNSSNQVIKEVSATVNVQTPLTISGTSTLTYSGAQSTLTASLYGEATGTSAVTWSLSSTGSIVTSNSYIALSDNRNGTATVTAIAPGTTTVYAFLTKNNETYVGAIDITVKYSAQITPSVTVYDSNSGYALTDTPDEGNTGSIADQIESRVRQLLGSSYSYSYYYTVEFDQTGNASNRNGYLSASTRYAYDAEDLDEVIFEPTANLTSSSSTAEASYGFTVKVYRNSSSSPSASYSGLMTFKIKQGSASSGDISYVAGLGEDVYFDVSDFEDFWNGSSRNTLNYVTFSSPSGGSLYNSSNKNTSSTPCYVDPTSRQTGLDGVYFSPNSTTSKKATTIRISFTAYGKSSGSKSGTVVITYLNKSASDITYSTNANGTVSLKASDFTAAYREATGSAAPSGMTIVFQGVPTYGSLTYLDSSKSSAKEVKLTNSNIKSRSFTTRTSGTNQLEDVTYTGSGTRSDTIEYIAYSGSTAQFSGKVVFNTVTAPTDVRVVLPTCTLSTGVALPPSYFTNANTAMANASYVIFSGTPRLGRLSYANGSATTAIPVNMLASVTYIPTGTNGTDSFNFTAYNSSNVVVASGTVNVVVALSTTSGGVSNINQFTDVAANAYYRTYLSDLISRGVIKGTGSGKFDPEGTLDYSQALKFILNAAGYVVPELEGANWALNYKTLAVQNGWLSSNVVLTNPISREAMAELAAKALGIGSSSAASPFSDTTNPYAVALYNTTPKIIRGQDSSAKPAFKPNDTLKRHEMVSLVYNMYQYKAANP